MCPVSDALGHASTVFTMDVYSHVLPPMGEQVADAMQAALGASGSKSGSKPQGATRCGICERSSLQVDRVPGAGVEPARAEAHGILSPARLPVPPSRPAPQRTKRGNRGPALPARVLRPIVPP